jgi:hypothetical protein
MLDSLTAHQFNLDLLKGDKHYSDRVALINVLFNRGRGSLKTKAAEIGITKVTEAFYSAVGVGEGKSAAARCRAFADRSAELLRAYKVVLTEKRRMEKQELRLAKASTLPERTVPGKIIPPDPKKSKKQRAAEDAATREEIRAKALVASAEQPAVPHPDADFPILASQVRLLEDPVNGLVMMQLEISNSQGAICVYNNGSRVAAGVVSVETLKTLRPVQNVDLLQAAREFLNPMVPSVPVTPVASRYLTAVIHCKELQPMTAETEVKQSKFAAPAKAGSKKSTPKASKGAAVKAKHAKAEKAERTVADREIKPLKKAFAGREGTFCAAQVKAAQASTTVSQAQKKLDTDKANPSQGRRIEIAWLAKQGYIKVV